MSLIDSTVDDAFIKGGDDVVFKAGGKKITFKDAADKEITFSEDDEIKIFDGGALYDADKTSATLTAKYSSKTAKTFDATVTNIDASVAKKKVNLIATSSDDTFFYSKGDGKDVIFGFENGDMLNLTDITNITGKVNAAGTEVYIKADSTNKAITFKDFTATEFNISAGGETGTYRISNGAFVKG